MKADEIYRKAIEKWGEESQVGMVIEECAELIVAISHARRDRATVIDIANEIADVEIMCGQLREVVGNSLVSQCKKDKLIRLEQRIERE